jgi:tetratricopeptide (TPR) repeat protein
VEGIGELEESVELARRLNSPELPRNLNNLGVVYGFFGRVREADAAIEAAAAAAERFGLRPIALFSRANRAGDLYRAGRWDEAIEVAETTIAAASDSGLDGVERICWQAIGMIQVARGDVHAAEAAATRLLATAGPGSEPQARLPALSLSVSTLVHSGRRDEAIAVAEELVAFSRSVTLPFPAGIEASFIARLVGIERFLEGVRSRSWRTPWLEAIEALLYGDPERAAELYARMSAPKDEAFARLEAAEAHAAAGRTDDARRQAEAALAFYRVVRAAPYVARAEALLSAPAASSG